MLPACAQGNADPSPAGRKVLELRIVQHLEVEQLVTNWYTIQHVLSLRNLAIDQHSDLEVLNCVTKPDNALTAAQDVFDVSTAASQAKSSYKTSVDQILSISELLGKMSRR